MLYGQPIVDLRTGETVMHELLLRMLGDDGEVIAPMRFLPAAARFGFMPRDRPVGDRAGGGARRRLPGTEAGGEPRGDDDRRARPGGVHRRGARRGRARTPPI